MFFVKKNLTDYGYTPSPLNSQKLSLGVSQASLSQSWGLWWLRSSDPTACPRSSTWWLSWLSSERSGRQYDTSIMVGASMRQLACTHWLITQNTCNTQSKSNSRSADLEKEGLLNLTRCKMGRVHYCVKLSVMIDHCIALNLLAVQTVQWKIWRQKAANICSKKV